MKEEFLYSIAVILYAIHIRITLVVTEVLQFYLSLELGGRAQTTSFTSL
jgi:hypothetical protein